MCLETTFSDCNGTAAVHGRRRRRAKHPRPVKGPVERPIKGPLEGRLRRPAQRRATAGLVALDERQHHPGRHQARPRMDAPRRPGRLSEFRCGAFHSTGGQGALGLYAARLEGRLQIRHYACRSTGTGRGHRRLARMERVGRPVGACIPGHEEICVERNTGGRRQALQRPAASSAGEYRRVSEPEHPRPAQCAPRSAKDPAVLCRLRRDCVSQAIERRTD